MKSAGPKNVGSGSWLFCARRALVDAALPDDQTVGGDFLGEVLAAFLVGTLATTDDRDWGSPAG